MKKLLICILLSLALELPSAAQVSSLNIGNVKQDSTYVFRSVLYKFEEDGQKNKVDFAPTVLPSLAPNAKGNHIVKIPISNIGFNTGDAWLKLPFLNCEKIEVYFANAKDEPLKQIPMAKEGTGMSYRLRNIPAEATSVIFKFRSSFAVFFPLKAIESADYFASEKRELFLFSLYFGIVFIMSLYNLFVFFSTKSISYLYYSIYSLSFGLAQFCLGGFFHILVSTDLLASKELVSIFSGVSGVFGILFFNSFLESKKNLPRIRKGLILFMAMYVIVVVLGIVRIFEPIFNLLNLAGMGVVLLFLIGSANLAFHRSRPAKFYLVAWAAFITGFVLFVLTNVGVIPYNTATQFFLPLGSAIEISLLSFALADKINVLSQENENLIREQNIILEQQVAERTSELMSANDNLRQTQTQLVNAEKMASLGHLTAGIAHEINNPINFISANISPLKRDIEDYELLMDTYSKVDASNYEAQLAAAKKTAEEIDVSYLKTEIQMLLSGIDEGARRTAEIVKNLKVFSHIDQAEHSYYSVNEGLTSTLRLLSHKLEGITVIQELQDIPPILCFPGKLNQVFMNLLSNSIDAMQGRDNREIKVKSTMDETTVYITIQDNGSGIPADIIENIFNPFFTTKEVGSGTGLGLSISQSIIKDHNGDISVESDPGKYTAFTIKLPLKQ